MRIAVHQMCSGIDPEKNFSSMSEAILSAASQSASIYFAPEMALMLDRNRERARKSITFEAESPFIPRLCALAVQTGLWLHIGSFSAKSETDSSRFANRSLLIDPKGKISARYDKMHLFDVDLKTGESWRESAAYRGGDGPVLADSPLGLLGLTVCYDLRFSELYSRLARGGAVAFAIPAAFTVPTGEAHWHVMLRARAIESAAFVIAAAQSGQHEDGRLTYGHSLVVDPWGDVLLDMGEGEGLGIADIDLAQVEEVRAQIPVHLNRRDIPSL